jgi:hypothetical protein
LNGARLPTAFSTFVIIGVAMIFSLSYRFQVTLRGEACAVISRSFEGMSRLDHARSMAFFSSGVRFDGDRPIAFATNVSHAGENG